MATTMRVFSGIQPTGIPQLGNYLGSIKNWVSLQHGPDCDKMERFYSVVDLHALTVPRDPKKLHRETMEMAAALIACGIDPQKSVLFRQSAVSSHSQLHWVLGCITPVGWLNRMTQWKSKLQQQQQQQQKDDKSIATSGFTDSANLNVNSSAAQGLLTGLFTYPILMSADILLYNATHVPVGEDQVQHLELARDMATHFNKHFKTKLLTLPQYMLTASKRVMSLKDPTRKMSKSDPNEQSRIVLNDSDKDISRKIKKSPTDSMRGITFDPVNRPGVSNLVLIYASLKDMDPELVVKEFNSYSNAQLKEAVAEAIVEAISPIRGEMQRLLNDTSYLDKVLREGEEKARVVATENWKKIAQTIGLTGY